MNMNFRFNKILYHGYPVIVGLISKTHWHPLPIIRTPSCEAIQNHKRKHRKYFVMDSVINFVTIINGKDVCRSYDWKWSRNHMPSSVIQCSRAHSVTFCINCMSAHKCLIVHPVRVQREESIKSKKRMRFGEIQKYILFRWQTIDSIKIITIWCAIVASNTFHNFEWHQYICSSSAWYISIAIHISAITLYSIAKTICL